MLDSLIEIAKILSGVSVAIMSMSVVTYALAVPRLQSALAADLKSRKEGKTKLEKRMKEESLSLEEVDKQLRQIEADQKELQKIVHRLSWGKVVVMPVILATLALCVVWLPIAFSDQLYLGIFLLFTMSVLLVGAFYHLLGSLRLIEETATRPGLSIEG